MVPMMSGFAKCPKKIKMGLYDIVSYWAVIQGTRHTDFAIGILQSGSAKWYLSTELLHNDYEH